MNLLAESGSTKTDWCEFNRDGVHRTFRTTGINPNTQSALEIEEQLQQELEANGYQSAPENLYFYGAGLRGQQNQDSLYRILTLLFPQAQVEVTHDQLAAARSTCQDQPGITCILGTGSNSCLYDGQYIVENIGGHGYLFGDEGGGSDLGKNLVIRALGGTLPADLITDFEEWVAMPILELRKVIYQSQRPNVYMAGLSRFIGERIEHPAMRQLVHDRFSAFFEVTVLRYPNYSAFPVNFAGSVAFFYREILKTVCREKKLPLGRFVQRPIEGLVAYHQKILLK